MMINKHKYQGLSTGTTIIKVKDIASLIKLINKLKKQNVKFQIENKKKNFEINIEKRIFKLEKLDLATGSSVFLMIQDSESQKKKLETFSIDEAIPDTPNILPPSKKKEDDLSDR